MLIVKKIIMWDLGEYKLKNNSVITGEIKNVDLK